jgi:Skp family chaperone for outer membrane proteins
MATSMPAQRPPGPAASAPPAALVDAVSITRNSAQLKQSLEALKKEYEASAAQFKQEADYGNQLGEKLKKTPPNSPEFKKIEQEMFKRRADFELHGARVTEDFKDREARLYYNFSRQLQAEVTRFAQANRVPLVLRYEPPPQSLSDPREIMQEVQRLIIYQRGLEATPVLLEAVNRSAAAPASATRPPAPTRPVQR